ncbi:MAG: hypothetical protein MUP09_06865 [Thiovulaceae bacterium]|nr:hypothetical protein [Sulfurimonadaceae bacterium]
MKPLLLNLSLAAVLTTGLYAADKTSDQDRMMIQQRDQDRIQDQDKLHDQDQDKLQDQDQDQDRVQDK